MSSTPTLHEIEQFLFLEARLLDEQRWDEWQALFVDEGEYWVPLTRGQPDPLNHVSIIYEKSLLRAVRIKRFGHPNALSLQPMPHSVHTVSNIMLDSWDDASGIAEVNSRFIMLEYRRSNTVTYGGVYSHRLLRDGGEFKIAMKKVELVNCDGVLESIQIYF